MAQGPAKWVWIFTPLVTLSFAGFLMYLTTVPAGDDIDKITSSFTEQAEQAKQDLADKAKAAASQAMKDVIKQELSETIESEAVNKAVDNFEFFEILENKKVTVEEVKEYKAKPKGTDKDGNKIQYRLKTGAFKSTERADRQKAALVLNGFETQVESADVNGETWYRVFTGPFSNRSQMNKARDQLVDMGIQSVEVRQTLEQ